MRIVCQQIAPEVTNADTSQAATVSAIESAVGLGADVVVLPELCTSGYVFDSADEVEAAALTVDSPVIAAWQRVLHGTGVVLVAGLPLRENDDIFNAAVMLDATGVLAVYRKVHLWDQEKRWFREGHETPPVVQTRHGRIGLLICYDLDFPEMVRGLFLQGADVVAVPTNWPATEVPTGEHPAELHDAMSAARLSRMFIACCDRAGQERGVVFAGASAVIGPDGWIRAQRPLRDVGAVVSDVIIGDARDKANGPYNDARTDRRPEVYAKFSRVD